MPCSPAPSSWVTAGPPSPGLRSCPFGVFGRGELGLGRAGRSPRRHPPGDPDSGHSWRQRREGTEREKRRKRVEEGDDNLCKLDKSRGRRERPLDGLLKVDVRLVPPEPAAAEGGRGEALGDLVTLAQAQASIRDRPVSSRSPLPSSSRMLDCDSHHLFSYPLQPVAHGEIGRSESELGEARQGPRRHPARRPRL